MKKSNKDPWKSFVQENRESFDKRKSKNLWAGIEEELAEPQQKTSVIIQLWKLRKIAAVFVLSLGLGYYVIYSHFESKSEMIAQVKQEKVEHEPEFTEEFLEAETYYVTEINRKLEDVITLTDNETIIEEIDLLREEFDELKKELGDHVNDERIIEAMIQNYRLRLELLKEILEELKQKEESTKDTKYETSAT